MSKNHEWRDFFDSLSNRELFVAATYRHGNRLQYVTRCIAERSLSLPPVDGYVDLATYLIMRIVYDDRSYDIEPWSCVTPHGTVNCRDSALLHTEDIVDYFLRYHASHKVTADLDQEKRWLILARDYEDQDMDPWVYLQAAMNREIASYRKESLGFDSPHKFALDEIMGIARDAKKPGDR